MMLDKVLHSPLHHSLHCHSFILFHTVCAERDWLEEFWRVLAIWTAFSAPPVPISWRALCISCPESSGWHPPEGFLGREWYLECSLDMVALGTPVWVGISCAEWPLSSRERMWLQSVEERDLMMEECGKQGWRVLLNLYTFKMNHHMTLFGFIWWNQPSQMTIIRFQYSRDKTVPMHQAH